MKHITKYQCEICQTIHDTEAEAVKCEAKGIQPPRFHVGESVYVIHRYPNYSDRPFGKRTVTKVITENRHTADYVFDKTIRTGKECWIGEDIGILGASDGTYRPANEYDNHLLKIGDLVPDYWPELSGQPLTEDLVDFTL